MFYKKVHIYIFYCLEVIFLLRCGHTPSFGPYFLTPPPLLGLTPLPCPFPWAYLPLSPFLWAQPLPLPSRPSRYRPYPLKKDPLFQTCGVCVRTLCKNAFFNLPPSLVFVSLFPLSPPLPLYLLPFLSCKLGQS